MATVLALVGEGRSVPDVGQAVGLTPGQVRACLRLAGLPPALRAAAQAGAVPLSVALKAARQPPAVQDRLASMLSATGTLTPDDVGAAAATDPARAADGPEQSLPLDWSPPPPPAAAEAGADASGVEVGAEVDAAAAEDTDELVYEPSDDRPPDEWWLTN